MREGLEMADTGRREVSPRVVLRADARHCLETAARREYGRLVRAFLRGELEEAHAEESIELVREFLERADFADLRRACEERMREGRDTDFVIFRRGRELACGFADEVEDA